MQLHSTSVQNQNAGTKKTADTVEAAAPKQGLKGASFAEGEQMLAPAPAPAAAQSFGPSDPKGIIAGLHPVMADKVRALIANAHARGLNIRVQEGMRSFQRQNELYAQGRTKPGAKVTNAKGGQSYHNYGVGVDMVFNGSQPYGEHHPWNKLGAAGEAAGLAWGASWGDRPHFQLGGLSIGTLQKWYNNGGLKNVWTQISAAHGGPSFNDAPGAPSVGEGGVYKVRSGDTLANIAKALLGNANLWRTIAQANGIVDPEKLRVGQELTIPGWKGGGGTEVSTGGLETHVVGSGDTLVAIAARYLGSGERWREIANANGISDPRTLKIGQVLKIPGGGAGQGSETKATPKSYVVRPGDTLSAIAQSQLGNAQRWRDIATANGISDPTRLKVGSKLNLP